VLFAAVVRGELFTEDLAEAQASHDAIASAGEAQAKAAGDLAHDVYLGTDLLGTTPDEFLAVDRWDDAAAMGAFYADPAIQQAFGSLFAAPPAIEAFAYQPGWHGWGDLDVTDSVTPHYWAVVRGRLASSDLTEMENLHDQIAAGGEQAALALGDLGHVVFLSLDDPREFLAIDLWDNPDGPVTLYTDPDFGAAFAQLFESPPSLAIYGSTDWHQW
jgi:quinol monooxygenase YgiN